MTTSPPLNDTYIQQDLNYTAKCYVDDLLQSAQLAPNVYEQDNTINATQFDTLPDKDLLITRPFGPVKHPRFLNKTMTTEEALRPCPSFVLVIDFNNKGGGTSMFLNMIVSKYKYWTTFCIARYSAAHLTLNINEEIKLSDPDTFSPIAWKSHISFVFVNHTLEHSTTFLNNVFQLGTEHHIPILTITHDYYTICDKAQPFFAELAPLFYTSPHAQPPKIADLCTHYSTLITQHIITAKLFSHIYPSNRPIVVVPLPDYRLSNTTPISNTHTLTDPTQERRLVIIGQINDIKGRKKLLRLIRYFSSITRICVKIMVIGTVEHAPDTLECLPYNSMDEFNSHLLTCKPHAILELSVWPETYSYTLTLAILTQLPIFYLHKKFNSIVKERLLTEYSHKAFAFSSISDLEQLILHKCQTHFHTIQPTIYYHRFWNQLFIGERAVAKIHTMPTHFRHGIQPFFIYSPQPRIPSSEIPSLTYYNIASAEQYDIHNPFILQKQIDLLAQYSFSGLAMYYSSSTHMKSIIDLFFSSQLRLYGQKIFFICTDQHWDTVETYIQQLLPYFSHSNYCRIANKPILAIYHAHSMTPPQWKQFHQLLHTACIQCGFDGVHLVLNCTHCPYMQPEFINTFIHFNPNEGELDYEKYLTNDAHWSHSANHRILETIAFDYNNRTTTHCIHNTEWNKIRFIQRTLDTYALTPEQNHRPRHDLDRFLLINSLNDWTQKMACEPSNKYGFYYLNLLSELLTYAR